MADCISIEAPAKRDRCTLDDWPLFLAITIVATILFSAASYPTLEGWGLWSAYERSGFTYFVKSLPSQCDRPLHLVPSLMAWLSPGRYDTGCMILGGLLTVLRASLAIAIIRSLTINRETGFLLFLICVLQPMWPAAGYERFHAAQISFIFFLSAFYCCTRTTTKLDFIVISAGFIFAVSGLMTYQALFVVAFVTPFILLTLSTRPLARTTALVFWTTCGFYIVYQTFITYYFPGSYTSSFKEPLTMNSIVNLYATVLNSGVFVICSLIGVTFFLCTHSWFRSESIIRHIFIITILLLTPVCGVIFYRNGLKLNDPDRIMFPVTVSLIIVFVAASHPGKSIRITPSSRWIHLACGLIFIVSFAGLISEPLRCVRLQLTLLHQLSAHNHQFDHTTSVRLVDNTGLFGDVYTFLPPHISLATNLYGIPGTFEICTSDSIARKHPYANRYPITTTPSCKECPSSIYSATLYIDYEKRSPLFGKSIFVHE